MKRPIKIILFIILCTSILGAYTYTNSQKKLTKKEIAEKVEAGEEVVQDGVVYFAINGYKFEVATKYMQRIMRLKSTKKINSAEMWALLPDFEAYDKNKNHYEFYEERGWGKRINVIIRQGAFTKKNTLENMRRKGVYKKYIENKMDAVQEVNDLESFPVRNVRFEQDLLYDRNSDNYPDINVVCDVYNQHEFTTFPGCEMSWNLSINSNLHYYVSFHRKYLPKWKEIKEKTELLIKNQL